MSLNDKQSRMIKASALVESSSDPLSLELLEGMVSDADPGLGHEQSYRLALQLGADLLKEGYWSLCLLEFSPQRIETFEIDKSDAIALMEIALMEKQLEEIDWTPDRRESLQFQPTEKGARWVNEHRRLLELLRGPLEKHLASLPSRRIKAKKPWVPSADLSTVTTFSVLWTKRSVVLELRRRPISMKTLFGQIYEDSGSLDRDGALDLANRLLQDLVESGWIKNKYVDVVEQPSSRTRDFLTLSQSGEEWIQNYEHHLSQL